MTKDRIASTFEIKDIIISGLAEFKNVEILRHPAMKPYRKSHYLNCYPWSFCHSDELFKLGLPQLLVANEATNDRLIYYEK